MPLTKPAARLAGAGLAAIAALAPAGATAATGCDSYREDLEAAFEAVPEMALGNRTKVERLLRDARLAETETVCTTKLDRAHRLVDQAYDDAGERLDLAPPDRR